MKDGMWVGMGNLGICYLKTNDLRIERLVSHQTPNQPVTLKAKTKSDRWTRDWNHSLELVQ